MARELRRLLEPFDELLLVHLPNLLLPLFDVLVGSPRNLVSLLEHVGHPLLVVSPALALVQLIVLLELLNGVKKETLNLFLRDQLIIPI